MKMLTIHKYLKVVILCAGLFITFNLFGQTCNTVISIGGVDASASQTICANGTVTYGIIGSPMSAPSWTITPSGAGHFNNGSTPFEGSSPSVTWLSNGTLTMTYLGNSGGSCSDQLFYTVTTNNAGTISGVSPVCYGNDATL